MEAWRRGGKCPSEDKVIVVGILLLVFFGELMNIFVAGYFTDIMIEDVLPLIGSFVMHKMYIEFFFFLIINLPYWKWKTLQKIIWFWPQNHLVIFQAHFQLTLVSCPDTWIINIRSSFVGLCNAVGVKYTSGNEGPKLFSVLKNTPSFLTMSALMFLIEKCLFFLLLLILKLFFYYTDW